jgi:hypothetical protein
MDGKVESHQAWKPMDRAEAFRVSTLRLMQSVSGDEFWKWFEVHHPKVDERRSLLRTCCNIGEICKAAELG